MIEDKAAHFAAVNQAIVQRDFDGAQSLIERALAENLHDAILYRLWARLHVGRGALGDAIGALNLYLERRPDDLQVLSELSTLQEMSGRKAEAVETYRRSLVLDPANGLTRELYSQGLLDQMYRALVGRSIGREASKSFAAKTYSGFFRTWLSGANILDIGYKGGYGDAQPIVRQAVGVDLNYPGYDGTRLPFADGSQDAVFSSHCLEHTDDPVACLKDWFRVLKIGGYAVIVVPHQFLYERRRSLPSRHPDHKHLFSPASLLALVEQALRPNQYRLRHFQDNDLFYDYAVPIEMHPVGCYEIELVIERIAPPAWDLA